MASGGLCGPLVTSHGQLEAARTMSHLMLGLEPAQWKPVLETGALRLRVPAGATPHEGSDECACIHVGTYGGHALFFLWLLTPPLSPQHASAILKSARSSGRIL